MIRYPHSPRLVSADMDSMIFPFGLVSFTIEKETVGTFQDLSGWLQGLVVGMAVSVGANVKVGSSVKVGAGVSVMVLVGGETVSVEMGSWV